MPPTDHDTPAAPPNPAMPAATPRALSGLRVLDFSLMIAGPYCARLLADLGAEVIKIESPEGDDMRLRQPVRTAADGTRHSSYFGQLNAGKKSLAIDLKHPEAVALVRQMALQADVVVENFRPGVMERLGLGAEALRALNPRLVFASISGYGQAGPDAGRAAYAMVVQAESGYEKTLARYAGDRTRPAATGTFVADLLGGIFAFSAIQSALLQRERTGQGQVVDVALMDCMLNLLIFELQEAQCPVPTGRPVYGPVAASDGDVLIAPLTERNYQAMASVTAQTELLSDARFAGLATRSAHWAEMMRIVEQWTRQRSVADVLAAMDAAGVPCARYNNPGDAFAMEQLRERALFTQVEDAAGRFLGVNAPWKFSASATAMQPKVPSLGEHAQHVLATVLGLDEAGVQRLREQGVFGAGAGR